MSSERRVFRSSYGGGAITAEQYLAELMCVRQAARSGETLLHRFWQDERWAKVFRQQLRQALTLLRLYSPAALVSVLRDGAGKNAWSLGARWLDEHYQAAQKKVEAAQARATAAPPAEPVPVEEPIQTPQTPRPAFSPRRNRLMEE